MFSGDIPSSARLRDARGEGEDRPEPVGGSIWRFEDGESWAMMGQTEGVVAAE